MVAPILPTAGSCKIERSEQGRGALRLRSGHSILQPPSVGKIGEESPNMCANFGAGW